MQKVKAFSENFMLYIYRTIEHYKFVSKLSSETTISGFNEMSKILKDAQKLAKQEQTAENSNLNKKNKGWSVDDDW